MKLVITLLVLLHAFLQQTEGNPGQRFGSPMRGMSGFPSRNRDGTIRQCDVNGLEKDGCGPNSDCVDSCFVPGLKECAPRVNGRPATRNCRSRSGGQTAATTPVVSILDEGASTTLGTNPLKLNFTSSISLVQAQGKNILVDTGVIPQKVPLLKGLRDHGLSTRDIDYVFTTHGHPDHYSNINLFPDAQQHFSGFEVFGYTYEANPLLGPGGAKFYALNNRDLEIINTPGHTPQDTSLIVRNGRLMMNQGRNPVQGTIGIVGDLFLSEDNAKTPAGAPGRPTKPDQLASMTLVACQVDYIIPGHGPPFDVRPYKTNFSC